MAITRMPMIQFLLQNEYVKQEQVHEAKKIQEQSPNKDLGQILIELKYLTERDVLFAKANELGVPFIDLDHFTFHLDVIKQIRKRVAMHHGVLPLKREGSTLWLAMVNINNIQALDDVRMATKCRVIPVLAVPNLIHQYIKKYYESEEIMPMQAEEASYPNTTNTKENITTRMQKATTTSNEAEVSDQAPVIKLANQIILKAIEDRASDIHIEPQEDQVRIRYRIDGVLMEKMRVDKNLQAPLVSRIKIMSEMDIAERRLPQDGRIQMEFEEKDYDLRTSSMPTSFGEKIVMRILDKSSVMIGLEKLGFTHENKEKIMDIASHTNGMFLCTGPTGSGKTTTLYSVLQLVNKPTVNVLTVEDPVEYQVKGISQVQVNRKAGLNFASALRSFLRQDPDIIMIGEMRDLETAQIAVESSLTGHLVLSTLHTNSAPSTILRLIDMGVEPYLISSTVIGILAQRLGRRLCSECKRPIEIPASKLERLGYNPKSPGEIVKIYQPVGCNQCRQTGYSGRVGFHELMVINEDLSELIVSRATPNEIRAAARKGGMKELHEDGLMKVLQGVTDPDEVLRVVYTSG